MFPPRISQWMLSRRTVRAKVSNQLSKTRKEPALRVEGLLVSTFLFYLDTSRTSTQMGKKDTKEDDVLLTIHISKVTAPQNTVKHYGVDSAARRVYKFVHEHRLNKHYFHHYYRHLPRGFCLIRQQNIKQTGPSKEGPVLCRGCLRSVSRVGIDRRPPRSTAGSAREFSQKSLHGSFT